jgi:hypothetical protein
MARLREAQGENEREGETNTGERKQIGNTSKSGRAAAANATNSENGINLPLYLLPFTGKRFAQNIGERPFASGEGDELRNTRKIRIRP